MALAIILWILMLGCILMLAGLVIKSLLYYGGLKKDEDRSDRR